PGAGGRRGLRALVRGPPATRRRNRPAGGAPRAADGPHRGSPPAPERDPDPEARRTVRDAPGSLVPALPAPDSLLGAVRNIRAGSWEPVPASRGGPWALSGRRTTIRNRRGQRARPRRPAARPLT